MEIGGQLNDFSPLSLSLLSPTDSTSSTDSNSELHRPSAFHKEDRTVVNDADSPLPSTHIDFLNLIFPPTPEKSPQFEPPQEQPAFLETSPLEDGCKSQERGVLEPQFRAYSIAYPDEQTHDILVPVSDDVEVCDSPQTDDTAELSGDGGSEKANASYYLSNSARYKMKLKRSLAFPPCVICNGKATGSHYGAITCEACKGFFRRYLQRKEEYKCTKGGNCEIINRNRGNCSGCRLQKCLGFGMSKQKSKLGRYTVTRRTEAIKNMKVFQGKTDSESLPGVSEVFPMINDDNLSTDYNPESEMFGRNICQNASNLNTSNGFNETVVSELVKAMNSIMPYGPDVKTKEDVQERHRFHSERYQEMIKVFGRMNTIPKEEYYKLYKGYGIDVDGRMAAMKICCKDIEGVVERYCTFAKHIPGFPSLPYKDQSTLLKVSRADFFIIIMNDAFSETFGTFIGQDGIGYHIEEVVDKFLSRELVMGMCNMYTRWQKLEMTEEEKALTGAMSLVFTDRCKLENRVQVEKVQYAIVDRIRLELRKTYNAAMAQRRFTRIIDTLTSMRDVSELYLKEFNIMCKDDIITEELPMLSEFFLEEYDNAEKK